MIAEPGAGQGITQAARDAFGEKADSVFGENAEPLKNTIANLLVFWKGSRETPENSTASLRALKK